MSNCSCGATVIWAKTVNDKWMPLNSEPDMRGNMELVETRGGAPPLTKAADLFTPDQARRVPHWEDCPHSERHRRK